MLKKLINKFIAGRQKTADAEVARILQRTEFKNESYYVILEKIRRRDLSYVS